jgi:hypothetical protein
MRLDSDLQRCNEEDGVPFDLAKVEPLYSLCSDLNE